ncbi:DNA-binding response regulator [Gammaproteobacteria bacterium 45_16_T64]|nr:DNA-binding response regulator [Gammaproteobacteria bacterium 45_16_T64]
MKTALLIEDHEDTQIWMRSVIASAFPNIEIHLAETLEQARTTLRKMPFTIALVDINLPDGSGIDLVSEIAANGRVGYIVMSTIFDDDDSLFRAIQAGAHGYLLKDQPHSLLIDKLKGIERGDPPLSPGIARRLLSYYRQQSQPRTNTSLAKTSSELSKREEEVITLIAKGITTKEVARMLSITTNTASGYVKSAYRKLDISSRAEASLRAVELGLVDCSSN